MVASLRGGGEIDLGKPAASELFDAGDIDGAVMQILSQARHIARDEIAINAY